MAWTHDWGPTGENACWRGLLNRLIVSRVTLHDTDIWVPRGSRRLLKKMDWTGQLSLINGTINPV